MTSKTTGVKIDPVADYVEGNMYSTDNQEHVGVLIMSIVVREPGVYNFSCQYMDGRTDPQIVLAVGPNIGWEFLNVIVKPVTATICGTFAFMGVCGLSILIIGFVVFKRNQSKKILAS